MPRPKAQIDENEVALLAYEGASNRDIAALLGVDHQTIANRFSPLLGKKRAERRLALRQMQWAKAEAGDSTMLIWLGKNELDQTDRASTDVTSGGEKIAFRGLSENELEMLAKHRGGPKA